MNGAVDRKPCSSCRSMKPIEEFHLRRVGVTVRQARCIECTNELRRVEPEIHGGLTYEEIAKRLGISREGVRVIEKRALRKLRVQATMAGWR